MATTAPLTPAVPTSSSPGSVPAVPVIPVSRAPTEEEINKRSAEIRVYGHSSMFYWWPVWVAGFVMAALTYMDGHVLVVVPRGTQVESGHILPGNTRAQEV